MPPWGRIGRMAAALHGGAGVVESVEPVGGGCIARAWRVSIDGRKGFLKHQPDAAARCAAEAAGLQALRGVPGLRVPQPWCWEDGAEAGWLLLEYLPLQPLGTASAARLGAALAGLHRRLGPHYGWSAGNWLGASPQPNPPHVDWAEFWAAARLGPQLEAVQTPALRALGERVQGALPQLLAGHRPPASLLHGDLWSGNAAALPDGTPVIYDPAVYWGDRETDLAMAGLFGGFPESFFRGYREAWPLPDGAALRAELYRLHHLLNHLRLFGAQYAAPVRRSMERLLAETHG